MVRSRDRAARYASHDFPDFAQEFLRRNHDYRAQHAAISNGDPAEQFARAWGLHFPGRSGRGSAERARMLAR